MQQPNLNELLEELSDNEFFQTFARVREVRRRKKANSIVVEQEDPPRQRSRIPEPTLPAHVEPRDMFNIPPVEPWLRDRYPFFTEYPDIFSDLRNALQGDRYFLIQGSVQGGKTPVISGLSLFLIKELDISVVTVVRNLRQDQEQLQDKFQRIEEPFYPFGISVASSRTCTFHPNAAPGLTIALENASQLRRLVENYSESVRPSKFALIIDEADAIAYKKGNPGVIYWLRQLMSRSCLNIFVTATAVDILYLETELTNRRLYTIPKDPNYKGIGHSDFNLIPVNMDMQYRVGQAVSPELLEWYERLSHEQPFEGAVKEHGMEDSAHPIICLQKTETNTLKQRDILCSLASDPRFRDRFVILVYNGKGVEAYFHELLPERIPGRPRLPSGVLQTDTRCEVSTRWYKKASIRDVLGMLRLCRQQYPVTHIVIIAGYTVARGLNIVSSDYKWHLTHEIMYHAPNATVNELIQSCRLMGIYQDSIPLKLYCNPIDTKAIEKAYYLQKRLIEGATYHEDVLSVAELVPIIRVFTNYIPEKRHTTKKCPEPVWNTVPSKAAQYSMEVEEKDEEKDVVHDGSSRIFRVLPERLREVSRAYYDKIVDYLMNTQRTRKWLLKAEVLNALIDNSEIRHVVSSSIWNWTSSQSDSFEYAETEFETGLLIRHQESGSWVIRLN